MLARLTLAAALVAAVAAPAATADGPLYVTTGGAGVVAGATRYIPSVYGNIDATQLLAVSTKDGSLVDSLSLTGQWGLPYTPAGAEGLTRGGKDLVLADVSDGGASTSLFMVVRTKPLRAIDPITLNGYFSYDAISPDGSKLYLIQYTQADGSVDPGRYVVREYDLRTNRLVPGRIADRTQKSWVMQGSPVTRTWSPGGRWVYTLYSNPGGYPFVHALDTVRGIAHCVGIPLANQGGVANLALTLHGRTLSVHWRSGRPFVDVNTATWAVTPAHRDGFRWWTLSFLAVVPLTLTGLGARARRARPFPPWRR
jgi:hypothetical protein